MNNNIILTSKRNDNCIAINAAYTAPNALPISAKAEPQHKSKALQNAPRSSVDWKIM
jgi:hypothetical protein